MSTQPVDATYTTRLAAKLSAFNAIKTEKKNVSNYCNGCKCGRPFRFGAQTVNEITCDVVGKSSDTPCEMTDQCHSSKSWWSVQCGQFFEHILPFGWCRFSDYTLFGLLFLDHFLLCVLHVVLFAEQDSIGFRFASFTDQPTWRFGEETENDDFVSNGAAFLSFSKRNVTY